MKNSGPLSSTSINAYVRGIKLLFSTLAKEGLIDTHPVASMPAPKPAKVMVKPFSERELRAVFKALGETKHPCRDRAVGLKTGYYLHLVVFRHIALPIIFEPNSTLHFAFADIVKSKAVQPF